jgi:hypothetical protein
MLLLSFAITLPLKITCFIVFLASTTRGTQQKGFVLVDTKKVIDRLERHNPDTLKHAYYKLKEGTPSRGALSTYL